MVVCTLTEIILLMYYGVYHSMRVAWAMGYRLSPLNEDRAFIADSLVRGAFELGNPENALYGIDPMGEVNESGRWRIVLVGLSWKGKIVLTAATMKFILGCIMPWHTAVWIKPWLSMPSDLFWNGMTAHIVIGQAQIRGVGVATAHEVFNEIMAYGDFKERSMNHIHKIQTARAIGVGIVKQGSLYPTMEVLLRHGESTNDNRERDRDRERDRVLSAEFPPQRPLLMLYKIWRKGISRPHVDFQGLSL